MKKIFILLFVLIIASGCTYDIDNNIDNNNIGESSDIIKSPLSINENSQFLDIREKLGMNSILCLHEGNIYYYTADRIINFYKYNISTETAVFLGKFELGYELMYSTDDAVIYDGYLYTCFSEVDTVPQGDYYDCVVSLCRIGLNDDSFTVISSEHVTQTLVYLDYCSQGIISYKGKVENDISYTYLDLFNPNSDSFENKQIIVFESDPSKAESRFILDFCVREDVIYVLLESYSSNNKLSFSINQYDLNGTLLESKLLPVEYNDLLENTSFVEIELLGKFMFIDLHSRGYVLDLSSDTLDVIIEDKYMGMSKSSKETDPQYFYSYSSCKVWAYDSNQDKIIEYSDNSYKITYMLTCNDDVFINARGFYYFPKGSFLAEK